MAQAVYNRPPIHPVLKLSCRIFAAIAAFILHWIIEEIALLLTSKFDANTFNWMYLVYPVIGIYLTSLLSATSSKTK